MDAKVVIPGADGLVGQSLIPALKQYDYYVTALTRNPYVSEADVNIADWMTAAPAAEAILSADVIIHLAGEIFARKWKEFYEPNVKTTERVVRAMKAGNVKKIVFISYPGADPNSDNLFLKSKGEAEKLLTDTGKDVVIFRVQAIFNTPSDKGPFEDYLTYKGTEPVRVIGNGKQRIHIIYRPDAIQSILIALRANNKGVYDLYNDVLELNEVVKLVNRNSTVRQINIPIFTARLFSIFSKDLSPTTVNLYSRKPVMMDNAKTKKDFGLSFTTIFKV